MPTTLRPPFAAADQHAMYTPQGCRPPRRMAVRVPLPDARQRRAARGLQVRFVSGSRG